MTLARVESSPSEAVSFVLLGTWPLKAGVDLGAGSRRAKPCCHLGSAQGHNCSSAVTVADRPFLSLKGFFLSSFIS